RYFFFDSPVQIFVFEEHNQIIITNKNLDQTLYIVQSYQTNHLQPKIVDKPHLRILRVERPTMYVPAARAAQHERSRYTPKIMRLCHHVADLVHGTCNE